MQPRVKLMKVGTMEVPLASPIKTVLFVPTVSTSMVETISVGSFVSVHGDESHDTPPTSTDPTVSASCGSAKKRDLSSSSAEKIKSGALDFDCL